MMRSGWLIVACVLMTSNISLAQYTCESAVDLTDSLEIPASEQPYWLKTQDSAFYLSHSKATFSYTVYKGSEGFCNENKKQAIAIFSSQGVPNDLQFKEAINTGKCICNSCLSASPVIQDYGSNIYIKVDPLKEPVKLKVKRDIESLYKRYTGSSDSLKSNIKAGTRVALTNILFKPNSHELLPQSKQDLLVLFTFLKKNPGVKIEIQGHVNAEGREVKEDVILSENRAKAIKDYLVKEGISAEQITHKGFGNKQMIYRKPKNEFQMMMNRRVEILILENKVTSVK